MFKIVRTLKGIGGGPHARITEAAPSTAELERQAALADDLKKAIENVHSRPGRHKIGEPHVGER